MPNIRVLIRDTPKMLRDILERALSDEPDVEVIPEPPVAAWAATSTQVSPDVFVVGANDCDPGERAGALLLEWPRSRVLMISVRGDGVVMYELVPQARDFGELSPSQLVQVIRSIVRPTAADGRSDGQ